MPEFFRQNINKEGNQIILKLKQNKTLTERNMIDNLIVVLKRFTNMIVSKSGMDLV